MAKRIFAILLLQVLSMLLYAEAPKIEPLPITGIVRITDSDGIRYMSSDRRFVFEGVMVDLWTGSKVDREERFDRMKLNRNGINVDRLAIHIGPEPRIVAFIKPNCEPCMDGLNYYFSKPQTVGLDVMLASIAPDDLRVNEAIWCSDDREKALREYAKTGRIEMSRSCGTAELAFMTKVIPSLGISALPFSVGIDNKAISGPGFIKSLLEK